MWAQRAAWGAAALLLGGLVVLLGVLLAGAGDVLKDALLPWLQAQPLPAVMVGIVLLGALSAALGRAIAALREKRSREK